MRLVNSYGPTEATIIATAAFLDPAETGRRPTVGQALPGTAVAVLSPDGVPVPQGTAGDLHLGGTGLARAYRGSPALTADRFTPARTAPAGTAPVTAPASAPTVRWRSSAAWTARPRSAAIAWNRRRWNRPSCRTPR